MDAREKGNEPMDTKKHERMSDQTSNGLAALESVATQLGAILGDTKEVLECLVGDSAEMPENDFHRALDALARIEGKVRAMQVDVLHAGHAVVELASGHGVEVEHR